IGYRWSGQQTYRWHSIGATNRAQWLGPAPPSLPTAARMSPDAAPSTFRQAPPGQPLLSSRLAEAPRSHTTTAEVKATRRNLAPVAMSAATPRAIQPRLPLLLWPGAG